MSASSSASGAVAKATAAAPAAPDARAIARLAATFLSRVATEFVTVSSALGQDLLLLDLDGA